MSLVDAFLLQASTNSSKTAIITGTGEKTTYAQMEKRSSARANNFKRFGIEKGDRVLVAIGMSVQLYETLIGLWKLGAVAVFPEPSMGLQGVAHAIEASAPKAIVATPALSILARIHPAFAGLPVLPTGYDNSKTLDYVDTHLDDPALITFTSGSTGKPKGIVRSVGFLLLQHKLLEDLRQTSANDVDLISLPVFVLSNLAQGATSVFPKGKITKPAHLKGSQLAEQISAHNINRIIAPPAVIGRLCTARSTHSFQSLTAIFTGGGPIFPNMMHAAKELNPKIEFHAVYGSTEAEPIAHISYDEISSKDWDKMANGNGLLAGKPIGDIQCRLVDSEVQVAGAHVNKGYLDPEQNKTTKQIDGETLWHLTGDAAKQDQSDRLWLLGRKTASNDKLYPFCIETAAMSWEGVNAAAFYIDRKGAPHLCVSGKSLNLANLSKRASALGDINLKQLAKIPMDKRHNSKVDYSALERAIS